MATIANYAFSSTVSQFKLSGRSRPKLLLVANYCSPYKGSDWRVGWGRVLQAAAHFDVWVITSTESRNDIERYFEENGSIPNVTFVYQGLGNAGQLLKRIPITYFYTNPFAYQNWQRLAFQLAQALHAQHQFDLTHQVNLIGFREPGELWKLDAPSILGPLGGTQLCPWRFLGSAGISDMCKEGGRNVINWLLLRFSPKVHKALKGATVVLAANSEVKRAFQRYRPDTIQLLETGLEEVSSRPFRTNREAPLRILWSGEIQFRKALHLLLSALAEVKGAIEFEVRILGRGPNLPKTRALAERLGISQQCEFLGWLPLEQAMEQSNWADIFVFTSLRDTSGNVMLEAMSRGVPVISFDHQGAGDIVTDCSGIKIPVTSPADAIHRFAQAMIMVGRDRKLLTRLSEGAIARARHFLWERNAAEMADIYLSALRGAESEPVSSSSVTGAVGRLDVEIQNG